MKSIKNKICKFDVEPKKLFPWDEVSYEIASFYKLFHKELLYVSDEVKLGLRVELGSKLWILKNTIKQDLRRQLQKIK